MEVIPLGDSRLLPTGVWVTGPAANPQFTLEKPAGPAAWIDGFKARLLTVKPEPYQIQIDGDEFQVTAKQAFEQFFRNVAIRARIRREAGNTFWFLRPAERDSDVRRRYEKAIGDAAKKYLPPDAQVRFFSEVDATAEYFRLVQGGLVLRREQNDAVLVIDCGALTFNATLAFSTKQGTFGEVGGGGRRGFLTALHGATVQNAAGRYVDALVLDEMRAEWGNALEAIGQSGQSQIAEILKLVVSRNGAASLAGPGGRMLDLPRDWLVEVTEKLWSGSYSPVVQEVLAAAYDQLSRNSARKEELRLAGIESSDEMGQFVRAVVLAGGTAQLPGFAEQLSRQLGNTELRFLTPGKAYPGVPALGAMARVLDLNKALALKSKMDLAEDEEDAGFVDFVSELEDDVFLHFDGPHSKGSVKLLGRADLLHVLEEGVERTMPKGARRSGTRIWLTYGPKANYRSEIPLLPTRFVVGGIGRNPSMKVSFDGRELKIVFGAGEKRKELRAYPEIVVKEVRPDAPTHKRIRTRSCPVMVVDIGMSKTMVVRAVDGEFDADDFAFLETEATPTETPAGWTINSGIVAAGTERTDETKDQQEVSDGPDEPARDRREQPLQEPLPPAVDDDEPAETPRAETPVPPVVAHSSTLDWKDEREFIGAMEAWFRATGFDVPYADVVSLHLALKVRPLALLAGPPGVGKTTLARAYGHFLGMTRAAGTWLRIPVQANWIGDDELLGEGGEFKRMLTVAETDPDLLVGLLLDEFNLTRPEYYFGRVLSAIESDFDLKGRPLPRHAHGLRLVMFGTLNIDETSRPPSDKVLDRAFVLELRQPAEMPDSFSSPVFGAANGRLSATTWSDWCRPPQAMPVPDGLRKVWKVFRDSRTSTSPHEDLTPSRRCIRDVALYVHFHDVLDLEAEKFSASSALDRAVAARILPRIRGEWRNVEQLVTGLLGLFSAGDADHWPICRRRVEALQSQRTFGFVSSWG